MDCAPLKLHNGRVRPFGPSDKIASDYLPPQGSGGYDGNPATIQQDATHRFVSDTEKTTWNGKAAGNHNHAGVYAPVDHEHSGYALNGHNHDGSYSAIGHNHDASYAAADHTHTKAQIEAVLTGEITTHTHPSSGGDPFTAKLRLANDVSTGANVTLVDLTGMSFAYEANSTYVIELYMVVTAAAATTGHGFGLNCSTSPSMVALNGTTQLANTGTTTNWQAIANNAIVGVTSGIPTANAITPSFGQGVLVTGAQAGTCTFRFRSETTAVTTCKAGSSITVMKIA